ncbi:hypothetical protein [Desulfosporosinus sp. SB140]
MMKTEHKISQTLNQPRLVSLLEIAKTFLHIGLVSYSLAALGKPRNLW